MAPAVANSTESHASSVLACFNNSALPGVIVSEHVFRLGIGADSGALADQQISDLQAFLCDRTEHVKLTRAKDNPHSQELGAVLIAVLSAPAIVELAKGIADWMRKRNLTVTIGKI